LDFRVYLFCSSIEGVKCPTFALHKNSGNQANRELCGLPRTAYSSVSSLSLNDEKWQFPLHLLPTRFTIFSLCYIYRLWLANFRQATENLDNSGVPLTICPALNFILGLNVPTPRIK
jgi:hypothetical protein